MMTLMIQKQQLRRPIHDDDRYHNHKVMRFILGLCIVYDVAALLLLSTPQSLHMVAACLTTILLQHQHLVYYYF